MNVECTVFVAERNVGAENAFGNMYTAPLRLQSLSGNVFAATRSS